MRRQKNVKGRDHLGYVEYYRFSVWGCELNSAASGYGPQVGCCEHSNEPSNSIQDSEFHDQFSDYELLKDSTLWEKLQDDRCLVIWKQGTCRCRQ